jgi:hypothetical protein
MYCAKCGSVVGNDAMFCANCGAPINSEFRSSEPANSNITTVVNGSGKAKMKLSRKLCFAIGLCGVVVFGISAIVDFTGGFSKTAYAPPSSSESEAQKEQAALDAQKEQERLEREAKKAATQAALDSLTLYEKAYLAGYNVGFDRGAPERYITQYINQQDYFTQGYTDGYTDSVVGNSYPYDSAFRNFPNSY